MTSVSSQPHPSPVRLLEVREAPLSVDEVLAAVSDTGMGGVVVFIGTVRDADEGREVQALAYSAHPSAGTVLREVAEQVARAHPGTALAAVHRVGDLAVGDLAVVVAASAPHRGEAFAACRALIDDLKGQVPIWKNQVFTDGSQEWVGLP
jgi:molybdopterin synthase catalytic subunit